MGLLLSDDFTGSVIDSLKWTETDPNGRLSQNGNISISNPHSSNISEFANKLQSVSSLSSGVIVVQGKIDWTTDSSNESIGGIYLFKDSNNFAYIGSRSTGGNFRLRIYQGGISRYSLESSIGKNKDVKIVYSVSTNIIKFYYWNTGTSAWAQIGTDQTWNLGAPLYYLISNIDNITFTGANPVTIDDAYLSDADYSSQYPLADFTYQGDIPLSLLPSSVYSLSDYTYQGNASLSLLPSSLYSQLQNYIYQGATVLALHSSSVYEGIDVGILDSDIGFLLFVAPIAGVKKIVLSDVPEGLGLGRNHITAISNRRLQNGSLISQVIASRKKSFSLDLGLYDKSLSVYFESIYENNESVAMTVYEYNTSFYRVNEYSLTVKITRLEDSKDFIGNTRSVIVGFEEV